MQKMNLVNNQQSWSDAWAITHINFIPRLVVFYLLHLTPVNVTELLLSQDGLVLPSEGTARELPGEGTPYNGLYGEAPPKRGTFFRLQVYKR